jgi:hypothetical protein
MFSEEQAKHEMVLDQVHESGVEEWYCPTCGRRFLLQWPPNYKKIVLEPGDVAAEHTGGKGGLKMGSPQIEQIEDATEVKDAYLIPWVDWMDSVDFESLWE